MSQQVKLNPTLWEIIRRNRKCRINVINYNDELIVNIVAGNKKKVFRNKSADILILQLNKHYSLC